MNAMITIYTMTPRIKIEILKFIERNQSKINLFLFIIKAMLSEVDFILLKIWISIAQFDMFVLWSEIGNDVSQSACVQIVWFSHEHDSICVINYFMCRQWVNEDGQGKAFLHKPFVHFRKVFSWNPSFKRSCWMRSNRHHIQSRSIIVIWLRILNI